jgi:hypothetical protein
MDGQTCRHTRGSGYGLGERRILPDERFCLGIRSCVYEFCHLAGCDAVWIGV